VYEPDLVQYAFQRRRGLDASSPHARGQLLKGVCRRCEQTARDNQKRKNRWDVKARDTIRRHATNLTKKRAARGLAPVTKKDLINKYGWDPKVVAHQAEYQYGNGCGYCHDLYASMGHGLADITLDVQDPEKEPYYRTNTTWCCMTCNRRKGRMSPEEFEADRRITAAWRRQQEQAEMDPGSVGMLFVNPASVGGFSD
jgi:hypothetical protein